LLAFAGCSPRASSGSFAGGSFEPVDAATGQDSPASGASGQGSPAGQPANWDADLRMTEATDVNPDPNVVEVNLEARVQMLTVLPSGADGAAPQTPMWTYNGTVPGPLIVAKKGNRVIVHLRNSLPEATTIHWHGVRVPNAMDGSTMVQAPVRPGSTFDYSFVVPDAGTYWYHPHLDSSAQVGFGLYGALVVEDPSEPALGDELVLMLSDVSVNADGTLVPASDNGWFGDYFGREGYTLLVNGKVRPTLRMRAGVPQRWRVIDASRSKFQRFVVTGVNLTRVAGDFGLSAAPVPTTRADLTPGEREEVVAVATAPPGTSMTANWQDADRAHSGNPLADAPLFDVKVTTDPAASSGFAIPSALRTVAPIDVSSATARAITFDDVLVNDAGSLGINGKSSTNMADMTTVHVKVGATEIWTVTNNTSQDHPFHMHGFPFQVLSLGGAPPAVLEWRDTVKVVAKSNIRLAVTFDDRPGMWMFHCHILDHAEMGMMAMLIVDP
jgi:FtsP/CotA-like multicopper oxidase with cupredoxin domain